MSKHNQEQNNASIEMQTATSNELVRVNEHQKLVANFIKQHIVHAKSLPEPLLLLLVRNSLKLGASIYGLGAGIPYIRPAIAAGNSFIHYFGYVVAGGTVVSYGLASAWVLNQYTNSLRAKSPAERQLLNTQCQFKMGRRIISLVLGAVATIPVIYITYINNHDNIFLTSYGASIALAHKGLGFNSLLAGESLLYKTAANNLCCKPSKRQRKAAIAELVMLLNEAISQEPGPFRRLIEEFQDLEEIDIATFFKRLRVAYAIEPSVKFRAKGLPKSNSAIVSVTTLVNPTVSLIVNGYISYLGLQLVLPKLVSATLAPMVAIPGYGLDIYATSEVTNELTNQGKSCLTHGRHAISIKNLLLTLVLMFMSSMSATMDAHVSEDALEQDGVFPWYASYLLVMAVFLSDVIFESYASRGIIFEILDWMMSWVSSQHREQVETRAKFTVLANLMQALGNQEGGEELIDEILEPLPEDDVESQLSSIERLSYQGSPTGSSRRSSNESGEESPISLGANHYTLYGSDRSSSNSTSTSCSTSPSPSPKGSDSENCPLPRPGSASFGKD